MKLPERHELVFGARGEKQFISRVSEFQRDTMVRICQRGFHHVRADLPEPTFLERYEWQEDFCLGGGWVERRLDGCGQSL